LPQPPKLNVWKRAKESVSSVLSKRKRIVPFYPAVEAVFKSPITSAKVESVRCSGATTYMRSMASQAFAPRDSRDGALIAALDQYSKKLKRNCWFSVLGSSEKGLMVKSRESWPTFKYVPPKISASDW